MILIETNNKPDANWNERLKESPYGTIFHSTEYALSKQIRGNGTLFLKFIDNTGNIVGQQLVLSSSRFHVGRKFNRIFNKIPKNKILQWHYGPVIFNFEYANEISLQLKQYLLKQKCRVSGFSHPFIHNMFSEFKKPFILKPWSTFLINLNDEKQDIWKKMNKHSVRKNIERSEKRGVFVKEMSKYDYIKYRKLSIKLGKDSEISESSIGNQWKLLSKIGYTGFLAYKNEEIVGGISISFFNGYLNEFNIVRTKRDYEDKLYSQDLLKWKIIEWAKKKGFRYYDFSGANPNPVNSKEEGILRYKKKWGGYQKNYYQLIL